jgi:cell division protein FtsB
VDPGALTMRWAKDMQRLTLLLERLLPVAVLLLALIGAPLMIFSRDGLPRLRGLERELASVEAENREAQREIEELRGYVARLRDDPAAVERIARDDLGLMRQSEIVFQFAKK